MSQKLVIVCTYLGCLGVVLNGSRVFPSTHVLWKIYTQAWDFHVKVRGFQVKIIKKKVVPRINVPIPRTGRITEINIVAFADSHSNLMLRFPSLFIYGGYSQFITKSRYASNASSSPSSSVFKLKTLTSDTGVRRRNIKSILLSGVADEEVRVQVIMIPL